MATYYVGMDVHCNNTELAVEKGRKIVEHHSVPTTIPAICEVLDSLSGKKHLAMEEGPMAGWLDLELFIGATRSQRSRMGNLLPMPLILVRHLLILSGLRSIARKFVSRRSGISIPSVSSSQSNIRLLSCVTSF